MMEAPMRPEEWIVSDDTGISSVSIWCVMMGVTPGQRRGNCPPSDPSDFGRCYRLLEKFPHWKPRLAEVAVVNDEWTKLIENWSECERLYLEEVPTGQAPKLYALMKKLLKK